MQLPQLDVPVCVGLIVIGVVAVEALCVGGPSGLTVAGTAIGGIAGWLARGATSKITTPDATVTTKDPAS